MGNFCSNCGAQVTGKFCSNCGAPTDGNEAVAEVSNVQYETLNGVPFDAVALFAAHKGKREVVYLIKDVVHTTGAGLKEAKAFVDAHYADVAFMQKVAAYTPSLQLKCPRCGSTNIQVGQKGFGYGKGAIGFALLGPFGGFLGGKGAKNVTCICTNCGEKFSPPKK